MTNKGGNLDLVLMAGGAAVAIVVTLTGVAGPLRIAAGLILTLALPGYALTCALFPRAALGLPERAALSVGLTLAVAILGGAGLTWLSVGLHGASWAMLLGAVTLGACAAATLRRRWVPAPERRALPGRVNLRALALCAVAVALLAGAAAVTRMGALVHDRPEFTQLWIEPTGGDTVRIGFRNLEGHPEQYRLRVTTGTAVLLDAAAIPLDSDATMLIVVNTPNPHAGIIASLFRQETPDVVYRYVGLNP